MSGINSATAHREAILQRQTTKRYEAIGNGLTDRLKSEGLDRAIRGLQPSAIPVARNAIRIFDYLDNPLGKLAEEILTCIGVSANAYMSIKMLCESDAIGLDPHEKMGVTVPQYEALMQLRELEREASFLSKDRTLGFSQKFDRKKEVEHQMEDMLRRLK